MYQIFFGINIWSFVFLAWMGQIEDDLTEVLIYIVKAHGIVLLADLPQLILQHCNDYIKDAFDRVGGLGSLLKKKRQHFVLKGTVPNLLLSLAEDRQSKCQNKLSLRVGHSFGDDVSPSRFISYLNDYCIGLGVHLNQNDFYNVSKLLQIAKNSKAIDRGFAFLNLEKRAKSELLNKLIPQKIPMGFQDIVRNHMLACMMLVLKKDALREAFDYQVSILDIYCERMMGYEEDCLLNAILVDARVLAFKVDRQTGNKDCSAIVIAKIHSVHSILKSIPMDDRFMNVDRYGLVTYHYEAGRVLVYRRDYHRAFKFLQWSYWKCPRQLKGRRWSICKYLIPVAATLNRFPDFRVLKELDLIFLHELLEAVKLGDVYSYRWQLGKIFDLLQWDVYRILMDLDMVLYRNLLKKLTVILKPKFLKSKTYLRALTMRGAHLEAEEVDCILVRLKELNMVKFAMRYKDTEFFAAFSKSSAFPEPSKWYAQ